MTANGLNVSRRTFLGGAAVFAAQPLVAASAAVDVYPSRSVRLLVGFSAGGIADIAARVMGKWTSEHMGQSFIIENRTGAGSNIATDEAIRAKPDGYTLLACASANAINASLYHDLKFNFIRDMVPIAGVLSSPNIMLVNPSLPVKTVQEFIDYAKANPGKINFASSGVGASQHLAAELFKIKTGIDMVHVPYRGGAPAVAAVMGGDVQVYFAALSTSLPGIASGLRPLGITTRQRAAALPDVPPVNDTVPGYDVSSWFGISGPKGVSDAVVMKVNEAVNAGLGDEAVKKQFAEIGGVPMPMTPVEFGKFIEEDTARWAEVVHATKLEVQ
jgi:tripartite-type tricarboxylate transporter receptor subunit TctC